ncbi:ABC transporter permease [Peloplasma aerotolerans]|uniref:ABC transporter permease n=1 Tax=Peloplasma aerotolerans TaxID=3044389 RepID=A0AAW6UBY3_9MOLU|nr:ABC transporter permease [Mariniplasma sp. M4Ah]MDI6453611.1 ABC transporter permease [Mariniplasma sp. M4Ah]MDR4968388.1 ABC transporter permease [Acholeplasmataceae bacterium]
MVRFYGLRVLKDYLGHIILIGLPVVLITLMTAINKEATEIEDVKQMALYIGIIYIIMFQGFGAAYTFEGIEHDFFKPFRNRLRATPVHPMKFVLANIFSSISISFLQSLVILGYVVLFYGSVVNNIALVLLTLLIGVILAQFVAAISILSLKKASKAQAVITVYIIIAMIIAGFFFPLPENDVTVFLSKFSSPLAWTHYAVHGFMNKAYDEALLGLGLLSSLVMICGLVVYRLSRRVAI